MSKSFRKDLTGQRFGRLTVLEFVPNDNKHSYWRCKCECGKKMLVYQNALISGRTKSCGCFRKDVTSKRSKIHGKTGTKLYIVWKNMKKRCCNPSHKYYKEYGGRGITVCDEWLHDFQAFYNWAMTNGYRDDLTIDRIDNDNGYSPENCRWVTEKQQHLNMQRNIFVDYYGKKITLLEAAEMSEINYNTLKKRYHKGDRGERLFRLVKK